ncbi:MAG: radical SAM protein [Desulfobacterales bacterium]|nr:radical SAM protein [Desulfobacterales bacterium]
MDNVYKPYIITEENKSIRLKVTPNCPWNCTFCHKEGGKNFDNIVWNNSIKDVLESMKERLCIKEIHYTGGEPTYNKHLSKLTNEMVKLGFNLKTTTNGQFSEKTLFDLINCGLKSFNFSFISMDPNIFLETQREKTLEWAKKTIEHQIKMILQAKKLGAEVKINTVVGKEEDFARVLQVYNFAKQNDIVIRFLNDLNLGESSVKSITKLVKEQLKAKKIQEKIIYGSSSKTSYYQDQSGFIFGIKEIRNNKLSSICNDCKEKCSEQFYGIRLESKDNKFFVRLCIKRSDNKSYMTLDNFFQSEQYKEIQKISMN